MLLLLLMVHVIAQPKTAVGPVTVLTVGTDPGCDYSVIQDAIDAVPNGSTEFHDIRVTQQQVWNENLVVTNKTDMRIVGQFADCPDASNEVYTTGSLAELQNAGGIGSGVFVSNSERLTIQNFKISGYQFGGVTVINQSEVNLLGLEITQNTRSNTNGGGIHVGGGSQVRVNQSKIALNQANHGAGIYCDSGFVFVESSEIEFNTTNVSSGSGGGLFVDGGCWTRVHSFRNSPRPLKIQSNTAHQYGGGVAVADGSRFETNTTQFDGVIGQVFITDNLISNPITAVQDSAGAGIYVNGTNSDVLLHSTVIANNNFSDQLQFVGGGAIALDEQATLTIRNRGPHRSCLDSGSTDDNCNQIKGHHVNNGDAAVIKIRGGSQAQIYHTSIFDNQTSTSSNQLASVLDGSLVMQGDLIFDNGTRPNGNLQQPTRLIRISPNGTFHGDFLTFNDNRLWNGRVIQATGSSGVNLTRSIVAEDNTEQVFLDSNIQPSQTLFDCLLVHENQSISGTDIVVGNPQFQSTWPYHIAENSPAVDMCDNNIGDLLPEADMDGDERGPCPGLCAADRFDAGADEFTTSDLIFRNGFQLIL